MPPTFPLHGALFPLGLTDLDGVWRRRCPGGREWWVLSQQQLSDPAVREALSDAVRPIAYEVFPHAAPSFVEFLVSPDRLALRSGAAVLCLADGRIGGILTFDTAEWGGERGFYAASAVMLPAEQRTGLASQGYTLLVRNEVLRMPTRALFAMVRTPNPMVYEAWRRGGVKMGTPVHPLIDTHVPSEVQRVAQSLADAQGFGDRLDPQTMVVHGAYRGTILPGGEGPYVERPSSGDDRINETFRRLLGPEDALLLIGRISASRVAATVGERTLLRSLRRVGAITPTEHSTPRKPAGPQPMRPRRPERRADDRRDSDRRALERRALERRERAGRPLGASGHPLPERRAHDRRAAERRAGDRRAQERRAGDDRRG